LGLEQEQVEQEIHHQLVHHKEIMVETELLRADQEVEAVPEEQREMLQIILEEMLVRVPQIQLQVHQ
jgi:hypothetical protein